MRNANNYISIRVPDDLKARLAVLAEEDRRTLSNLIRIALERYAQEREAKGV